MNQSNRYSQVPCAESATNPGERRSHPRMRCKGYAELHIPGAGIKLNATVDDLSLRGCCLECEGHVPVEPPAQIQVLLRVNGMTVQLGGVLRRVQSDFYVGIEFTDVGPRKAEHIRELMDELFEMEKDQKRAKE